MSKIKFVSSWDNFDKATWSGTPYGIYQALSKKADVELVDASVKSKNSTLQSIKTKIEELNANIKVLKIGIEKLNQLNIEDQSEPMLVFSEYNSKNAKSMYCYQDLSVDFLIRSGRLSKKGILSPILNKSYKRKNKIALDFYKSCAGIFTMSEWLREDLIKNTRLPEDKVHAVGGGCNIDVTKIDYSKKQGNKFIFVGVNWKRKNGDLVVRAFEKLQKIYPALELYIVGPKSKPAIPENKNIHFLGNLSFEKLHEYYNLCDYFVMPSEFEAYGLVFAEALCFGLPCIGKNHYAMPEFIKNGENGYLINESSEMELLEKMKLLYENRRAISSNVQSKKDYYIQKYSWGTVADRILKVMKKDGFTVPTKPIESYK